MEMHDRIQGSCRRSRARVVDRRRVALMSARPGSTGIAPWQFDEYVLAEADGFATPEQIAVLEADPVAWRVSLGVMLREAEENLTSARSLTGDEREQVLADLEE